MRGQQHLFEISNEFIQDTKPASSFHATVSEGSCDSSSVVGGATGWLVTSGNVTPGEVITLRVAIWDTSDQVLDSLAVIDGFTWSTESTQPGTVILREAPAFAGP